MRSLRTFTYAPDSFIQRIMQWCNKEMPINEKQQRFEGLSELWKSPKEKNESLWGSLRLLTYGLRGRSLEKSRDKETGRIDKDNWAQVGDAGGFYNLASLLGSPWEVTSSKVKNKKRNDLLWIIGKECLIFPIWIQFNSTIPTTQKETSHHKL